MSPGQVSRLADALMDKTRSHTCDATTRSRRSLEEDNLELRYFRIADAFGAAAEAVSSAIELDDLDSELDSGPEEPRVALKLSWLQGHACAEALAACRAAVAAFSNAPNLPPLHYAKLRYAKSNVDSFKPGPGRSMRSLQRAMVETQNFLQVEACEVGQPKEAVPFSDWRPKA